MLHAWRGGNDEALAVLLPEVYDQLRQIAGRLVRKLPQNQALEATALVHEAYFRLIDLELVSWKDRTHFFAMCARIMRQVLVDHVRYHSRDKRGGSAIRVETAELRRLPTWRSPQLIALDDALNRLMEIDAEKARIVELRFFGGLDRNEIGEVLGLSSATVTRRWRSARAWLLQSMSSEAW